MIRRPATILVLLTGLNLLNYLDRFVLSAVLPKLQEELSVDNFVGGLLATVFLLGYFATAPIFGALGDRMARRGLIVAGVVVWSVATAVSGLATGALVLFVARAFVGVGEASYATLAPTVIDDVTPEQKKGTALAVFYAATPIGAALGYLVGGFVEKHWGWRHAFYVAGGPGLVLGLVCMFMVEPERKLAATRPDIRGSLGRLLGLPTYRAAVAGYCAQTFAVGAFSYWAPKFLYERYQLPLATANFRFGLVTVVAGGLATWIGGRWADRKRRAAEHAFTGEAVERATLEGLLHICALGSLAGAPLAAAAFLSPSAAAFFVFTFFAIATLFLATSPINALLLRSCPPELRASAMAFAIFAIHMFGDLWSPPLVGKLADHMPIQIAMLTLPFAIGVSAALWWPTARRLAK